jgi:hypothetical protein
VKSACLIHFESLHQDAGTDHIRTVCQGIHDIVIRPPQIMQPIHILFFYSIGLFSF